MSSNRKYQPSIEKDLIKEKAVLTLRNALRDYTYAQLIEKLNLPNLGKFGIAVLCRYVKGRGRPSLHRSKLILSKLKEYQVETRLELIGKVELLEKEVNNLKKRLVKIIDLAGGK